MNQFSDFKLWYTIARPEPGNKSIGKSLYLDKFKKKFTHIKKAVFYIHLVISELRLLDIIRKPLTKTLINAMLYITLMGQDLLIWVC